MRRLFKQWQKRYRSLNPRFNLPTKLTVFRIGLSPIFFILLMIDHLSARIIALVTFIIAAISDAYDGYLARKDGQVTKFGKIIDPIADKLLISVAFIGFYFLNCIPLWIVIVILFREYFITFFRILGVFKGIIIGADKWGKYKTTAQMTYIITQMVFIIFAAIMAQLNYILPDIWLKTMTVIIMVLLYCAFLLTVLSGLNYVYKHGKLIKHLFHEKV